MTWPTTPVATTNLDAGTDSPAAARADLKTAVDNINAIAAEFGAVDTTGRSTNDVLAWDGSKWAAATPAAVPTQLDDLTDVDLTTPPTDGQALVWSDSSSAWQAGTVSGGGSGSSIAVFNLSRSTFTPGGTWTNIGSYFTQLYNGTSITYSAGVFSIPAGTWLLEFAGVRATISGGSSPVDNTDFRLRNTTAGADLVTATTIPTGNDSSENYGHFIVCKPFTLSGTSNVQFEFISNESATIRAANIGIKFTQLA